MRKLIYRSFVFIFLAATAGIIFFPSSALDEIIYNISDKRLHLADSDGTIWSGSGKLQSISSNGKVASIEKISWSFYPKNILHGKLSWKISQIRNNSSHGFISLYLGSLIIEELNLHLPAEFLSALSAKISSISPSGKINITIHEAFFSGINNFSLDSEIEWINAKTEITTNESIGSYKAEIKGSNDIELFLSTINSTKSIFMLEGTGKWMPGSAFKLELLLTPQTDSPYLLSLAKTMGSKIDQDRYRIEIDSSRGISTSGINR